MTRTLAAVGLGLLLAGPAVAAAPSAASRAAAAAREARSWRQGHEHAILDEFTRFLALPNVANDRAGIERNAEMLRAMLVQRGLTVEVCRFVDAPPLIVADLPGPAGARTIPSYANYAGQATDTPS